MANRHSVSGTHFEVEAFDSVNEMGFEMALGSAQFMAGPSGATADYLYWCKVAGEIRALQRRVEAAQMEMRHQFA